MKLNKFHIIIALFLFFALPIVSQEVPSSQENIPYLVTFGQGSDHAWGDDDFSQTVFFSVPKNQSTPFYIRVFDPETFGELDEVSAGWDTKTKFSIYGGNEAYSHADARGVDPKGNYKSGTLLDTKNFGSEASTDNKWYTFGPFNPMQGELVEELGSYIFKVVVDGMNGNDGNLYKLFLSVKNSENIAMDGANAFAYEYSVRLNMSANSIAHIYPFADNLVTAFKINSFDFDNDGQMKLFSSVKNGHIIKNSGDNEWVLSTHVVKPEERNKSLDMQIVKKGDYKNDVVFYITNEYDMPVPFFAAPIGGVPRYKYKIKINSSAKVREK